MSSQLSPQGESRRQEILKQLLAAGRERRAQRRKRQRWVVAMALVVAAGIGSWRMWPNPPQGPPVTKHPSAPNVQAPQPAAPTPPAVAQTIISDPGPSNGSRVDVRVIHSHITDLSPYLVETNTSPQRVEDLTDNELTEALRRLGHDATVVHVGETAVVRWHLSSL